MSGGVACTCLQNTDMKQVEQESQDGAWQGRSLTITDTLSKGKC